MVNDCVRAHWSLMFQYLAAHRLETVTLCLQGTFVNHALIALFSSLPYFRFRTSVSVLRFPFQCFPLAPSPHPHTHHAHYIVVCSADYQMHLVIAFLSHSRNGIGTDSCTKRASRVSPNRITPVIAHTHTSNTFFIP